MNSNIHFYEIGNLTIMEIQIMKITEYYIRETNDPFDYFRFSFGSDKKLNRNELEKLMTNGYFEEKEF